MSQEPELSFPRPFVVLSLPRSRSAWLAHWLHDAAHPVGHDIAIECRRPSDFVQSFANGLRGSCETAAVEYWREIREAIPNIKFLLVRRPIDEVRASLREWGLTADAELELRDAKLDELERQSGVESVSFADLRSRSCRQWLWSFLLPDAPFDSVWDASIAEFNIQVNMFERVAQLYRRRNAHLELRHAIH